MLFPWVAVAPLAELAVTAFDGSAVAAAAALAGAGEDAAEAGVAAEASFDGAAAAVGAALAGAVEDAPEAGGVAAAELADVPPRLVT